MDPSLMFPIVLICVALPIFGLGGLMFIVMAISFFKSAGRIGQAMTTPLEYPDAEVFIHDAQVRPWVDTAWNDLSVRWQGKWYRQVQLGVESEYANGVIESVQEPNTPGWIAFSVQRRNTRDATIIVKTSEARIDITVTSKSRLDPNVQATVKVDGTEAGTVAVTYPNNVYRSNDGRYEARWVNDLRWKGIKWLTADDIVYDIVTVNNRPIGAWADTWINFPDPQRKPPFPPATKDVALDMSKDEAYIYLIALGMTLYTNRLLRRKGYRDW
jgi:hypothetical protein